MYQHLYQRFLDANPGIQHFACHSHHYWPDITRQAMLDYWDDSARWVDDKWQHIFNGKLPATQKLIAETLNTGQPEQIVFAPNTHELLVRIISCLDFSKPIKILTTDSEFHSFDRQIKRLSECHNVQVDFVATQPFTNLESRLVEQARQQSYDLIFVSQVFFNSAVAIDDLNGLTAGLANTTDGIIVIDGYHGFMALPTDLSKVKERIFYLAGSYKYAQGGEGCCFAHVPTDRQYRPVYTGWFAAFGALNQARTDQVGYAQGGMAFAGATMDFSALYRLHASLQLFAEQGLTVARIHQYVKQLQQAFLQHLELIDHPWLQPEHLLQRDVERHGHFLTFQMPAHQVSELAEFLHQRGIVTDFRDDRLRFGFALYHCAEQYDLHCLTDHKQTLLGE